VTLSCTLLVAGLYPVCGATTETAPPAITAAPPPVAATPALPGPLSTAVPTTASAQTLVNNSFFNTDLRQALSDVATQLHVNIIADESVGGLITLDLKGVPLDQALGLMLLSGGYLWEKIQDGVYLVTSADPAAPNFRKIAQTQVVELNYIDGKELAALLPESYGRFVRGDLLGNRVLVCAPPKLLAEVVAKIKSLDTPPVQVMIEALVVEAETGALQRLELTSQSSHLGLDTMNGIVSYTGEAQDLLHSLLWLVTKDQAQIKANPRVVAQEGREAKVEVSLEQYFELLSGTVGYQYTTLQSVKAAVSLTITPRVALADKQITCIIAPSIGDVTGTGANNLPIITTRSAATTVRVADGEIIAIGGLQQEVSREIRRRIPILSEIPVLGQLFRSHRLEKSQRELTIFVVPHLLDAQGRFQGPLLLQRLQPRNTPPATTP
jgi:type II secretory pathway component HofQ